MDFTKTDSFTNYSKQQTTNHSADFGTEGSPSRAAIKLGQLIGLLFLKKKVKKSEE